MKRKILVWGFCGELNYIVDDLRKREDLTLFNISDHPTAEINIFDCFRRKMEISNIKSPFRDELKPHLDTFKELYSRHWYPKYISDDEYLEQFNYFIDYFTELIDKDDFDTAIFVNIPHEGPEFIIYHLFKLLNKKTIVFYQSIFENRSYISDELNIFNPEMTKCFVEMNKKNESELKRISSFGVESVGNWFCMKRIKISKNFNLMQLKRNARRHFKRSVYLMLKLIYKDLLFFREYHKYNVDQVNFETEKYVYFPFHLQPELTTSILGCEFVDQIHTLKTLSKHLPKDISIIIKENPYQNGFKRPSGYFKEVSKIKNIKMVPMSYSSIELIQHSLGVATINGTCGWEGIILKKPVLVFGKAWYAKLDGVYDYHVRSDLEAFLKFESKDFNVLDNTVQFLTDYSFEGIVDHDYIKIAPSYNRKNNSKNIVQMIMSNLGVLND